MSVGTMRRPLLPEWLRPPEQSEDGTMALVDHLRELRYRLTIAAIAVVVGMIVCLIYYKPLLEILVRPMNIAIADYVAHHPHSPRPIVSTEGVEGPLLLAMKVGLAGGLITSCPVWLYQLWAFIVPGLLEKEKKYALGFLGAAVPLFLSGIAVGYWISPKGFSVMLNFNPSGVTNINELQRFLSFQLHMLAIFGLSFLLPVILVALNLIGLVRADQLTRFRMPAIFACFIFGAVATPSTDPFSMCVLAVPMALMYIISELITAAHDRRKMAHDPYFKERVEEAARERQLAKENKE